MTSSWGRTSPGYRTLYGWLLKGRRPRKQSQTSCRWEVPADSLLQGFPAYPPYLPRLLEERMLRFGVTRQLCVQSFHLFI